MSARRTLGVLVVAGVAALLASAAAAEDDATPRLLARATFGARPGDLARVRAIGAQAWLEQQLHPERIDDSRAEALLKGFRTLQMSTPELLQAFPRPDAQLRAQIQDRSMTAKELMERYPPEKRPRRIVAELAAARMVRAVASERQLQEVMVDFWLNHFNVFAMKGFVRWYVTDYEGQVIRPHALGTFGDLLRASAHHPAMLFYLDNWVSARPGLVVPISGRRAGLNENYARELMELHTLGVDGGYTQKDVTEVARAFTGWSIDRPLKDGRFIFRPRAHDDGEKIVLGHRLAPGNGQADGERVLDLLVRHPATAKLIAEKLVRRFVSDEPPAALVREVAETFTRTDGDIKAMLRAIFASSAFRAADASTKLKKPTEFVVSAVRALDARVTVRGGFALARASGEIGETLYGAEPPTGWPDRADAWLSAGTLLARLNFAAALAEGRVPGVQLDTPVRLGEARGARDVALALGSPEFQRR